MSLPKIMKLDINDSVLRYDSWNANGIDEVKIKCMMPTWTESDLIFIQETKLNSSEEPKIQALALKYGFNAKFHSALKGWLPIILGELYDTEGPQFTQEPSRSNYFTNVQGLVLHCDVKGSPQPQVQWSQKDGQPLLSYSGIREIFSNGTIHFPPFPVSFYRPDVHDQIIVCVASNSNGKIRSLDIYVRAVINQRYEVRAEDAFGLEGSDILFNCVIPDSVKDFVSVTSWIKDGLLNIFPHSGAGGRYFTTPSGQLLIEDVTRNDSFATFRCRTVNKLTGETTLSENSARLQLPGGSKSKPDSPPSITSRISKLRLREGDVGVLLCLSDGSPSPSHWWMRSNGVHGGLESLRQTERIRIRKSAVIIENVGLQDAGIYVCWRNNTSGSDSFQIRLVVTSPLTVQVIPPVLTMDIGKSAEFTCWTNSPEETDQSTERQISWRKDGIELKVIEIRSSPRLSITESGEKLRIANVQREDKGIYQCFVKFDSDMAQAAAELRLGDAAPQLVYRFIEQTLSPKHGVSLKCSASAGPTPHISWTLDSFPVPQSERLLIGQYVTLHGDVVSHVNITSTRVEDGGEWTCTASNRLGSNFHSARLNIYDGQTLPLTRRQLVSPDGTLIVKDVDRSSDAGFYVCSATNNKGNSDRKGFQLNVVVPPTVVPFSFPREVKEGEKIFVTCVVSQGDAPMRLQWLKNAQVVGDTTASPRKENKSGVKHPSDLRSDLSIHRIGDSDALVLQITHVKFEHGSNWTCKAKNPFGTQEYTQQLVVHVAPRIAPIYLPSQVIQGSRVQVVCSVEQGDIEETNLTVTWLKDSEPIPLAGSLSTNFVKVVHVDAYSAMLIIDRVDSVHGGNYTCSIGNIVSTVSRTVPLIVHGNRPENYRDIPVQSTSPTSSSLGSITLQHQPGGGVISSSSEDVFSLTNGSLIIKSARKSHQGFYLLPVHVKELQRNVSSRVGGRAMLRCEITGDGPIEVGWRKGLVELKPETDPRYQVRTLNSSQGTFTSELTINNVGREDGEERYLCYSTNHHGRSQGNVWLYVQAISNDFHELTVPGQVFAETVANLKPARKYSLLIIAENQVGQSEHSALLEIKTDGEPPEGAPKNVRVSAVSVSDIQVTWSHPDRETWHSELLLGYYVGYKRFREGDQYQFKTVERQDGLQEYQIVLKELFAFSSYEIVVQAFNANGAGPNSDSIVATTLEDVPITAPDGLHCTSLTSHSLQLGWSPLSQEQARGVIKGYKVLLEKTDFDLLESSEPLVRTTPSTNIIIGGLAKYKNYSVQVQSFTGAGPGPLSQPLTFCHTEEDLPGNPASVKISINPSSPTITVTWLPPAEPNGILTKYTVYISTPEVGKGKDAIKRKRQVPPDVTKFQFDGLRMDEKYELRITASTKIGEGNPAISHKLLIKTVQSAIISFGMEFRVVWKTDLRLPCETVGPQPIQWTRLIENRESERLSGTQEGSLMIRNARDSDSGNYSCSINDNKGHIIDSIMHQVIVQVPPLGPLLNVAVNSHSSLNLQWKVSDTGGAPIRGYILHLKASGEWLERSISRHLTFYELRDLECGTEYQMYLVAFNRAGMGRASELLNVSTLGDPPSLSLVAPQFMVETNQTWARVLLRDVWSGNGCPLNKFQVLFKESGASHWQAGKTFLFSLSAELTGESHSAELLGLRGGTTYQVKVVATNTAGKSQAEVTINTPDAHDLGAETSNKIMNYSETTPFYSDIRLMIPIVLSSFTLLIAVSGICLCFHRKAPVEYRSTDQLSMGTSSSSTYFKQNHRNSQQQVYMTVKKSTPMKGVDVTDLEPIPQYADDIHPYATFELNENSRDSKGCILIPTLERRRSSNQGQWNQNAMYQDKNRSSVKPRSNPRSSMKQEESEEYDSGSGTDTERVDPYQGFNKSHTAMPSRLNSKFQDCDSHAHGNRYEFAPPTGANKIRTRQIQSEIQGMVIADPYSFNDAFPTDERRSRKPNKRRSQGHSQTTQMNQEATEYPGLDLSLDPPYGFKDQHETTNHNKKINRKSNSSTEYAIAV
ncbi:Down syndrome cell adhesion molecule-like protein Dscam2 [Folsomia candida]|uniref:Down syndrome cell adhesion molecule-like protein Dscam2 n=1 Tax=Folsomia candida TaxID=158441 RepID=A0A226F5B1_FOLCA|nr:Down syndrome cell adhesion molecule-like protein Dscam2 [Folsomia candida]